MVFALKAAAVMAVASTANAIAVKNACTPEMEPMQVRLAYVGDSGMAVSWNTNVSLSNPTVYYGNEHAGQHSASSKISTTYETSTTWNNHVVISGLKPNTKYHYQPQCATRDYTFTTARSSGDGTPFQFAMVGDMGTFGPDGLSTTNPTIDPLQPGALTTIQSLQNHKSQYDFVWHGTSLKRKLCHEQD